MQGSRNQEGIGLLIAAARRRIKQVVWSRLEPYRLTPQQFWVLLVLLENEGLSLHELAQQVWADDPTDCRIVSRLAQQRLIHTPNDPTDRRRFRLRLTPRGRKLGAELRSLADQIKAGLERGLSAADRDSLRGLLQRVVANMDRMDQEGKAARTVGSGRMRARRA